MRALIEVGPRDGFQLEARTLPTEIKLEIIERLADAGLQHIQVASFVNPSRVPQMADAEELVARLPEVVGVEYSGLVLNSRGVERAYRSGVKHVEISISASDTHSRKNTGMPLCPGSSRKYCHRRHGPFNGCAGYRNGRRYFKSNPMFETARGILRETLFR